MATGAQSGKPTPRGITISTYIPPAEALALRDRADANDRTVAAEIRRAIRQYMRPS